MRLPNWKNSCKRRTLTWDLFPTGQMPLWIVLLILLLDKVSNGIEQAIDIVTTLLEQNIKL